MAASSSVMVEMHPVPAGKDFSQPEAVISHRHTRIVTDPLLSASGRWRAVVRRSQKRLDGFEMGLVMCPRCGHRGVHVEVVSERVEPNVCPTQCAPCHRLVEERAVGTHERPPDRVKSAASGADPCEVTEGGEAAT